jgi:glutathione S-transferase
MMPRPFLRNTFGLTYRKIPVCFIGQELYCDTSIILEALEYFFPPSEGYKSLYPQAADGRTYQPLIRGFASYWTDRPLFRVTTGLIPGSVWRTSFGVDRSNLIGHKLDPEKLEKKVPLNLSSLDLQLSLLEPLFNEDTKGPWIFSTEAPSAADISLYYQLKWGNDIAAGRYIGDLTGGGTPDTDEAGAISVFNPRRYPRLSKWFQAFSDYIDRMPDVGRTITDKEGLQILIKSTSPGLQEIPLIPTPAPPHTELDARNSLHVGVEVFVAPDDTGRSE